MEDDEIYITEDKSYINYKIYSIWKNKLSGEYNIKRKIDSHYTDHIYGFVKEIWKIFYLDLFVV